MTNKLRLVLDTNVLVSAILLPRSAPGMALDIALEQGRLLASVATIAELEEVLRRPKFNKYTSLKKRLEFIASLMAELEIVDITKVFTVCRDMKDNKFLELAVSGMASHIISGDADLHALHPFQGIPILTPHDFLINI